MVRLFASVRGIPTGLGMRPSHESVEAHKLQVSRASGPDDGQSVHSTSAQLPFRSTVLQNKLSFSWMLQIPGTYSETL